MCRHPRSWPFIQSNLVKFVALTPTASFVSTQSRKYHGLKSEEKYKFMSFNNPYGQPQSGPSLPSSIGTALDRQSSLSSPYSAQFPSPVNGSNAQAKAGNKRKRAPADVAHRHPSEDSYNSDGHESGPTSAHNGVHSSKNASNPQNSDVKKRTKTQRACDKCRTKKIRCDVLPDTDPPLCAHCKQYNYDCTFFLPIQETRFKKKRQEEDASLQGRTYGPGHPGHPGERSETRVEVRTFGPTSVPFMINSTAALHVPVDVHGLHPRNVWNVVTAGDGYIKVGPLKPVTDSSLGPKAPDVRVERDIVERLINSYFANISPILPIITKAEFVAYQPNPPPILLYSICLMAATLRDTPRGIFDALRKIVSSIIKNDDVLSTPSLAHVQALLVLSMTADCHGTQPNPLSFLWVRSGVAIRMAQDLNLHRAEISKEGMETRRRVWATCVVVDRWQAASFGYPQMIDLTDCDVRLPTPQDQGIGYLNALTRLSIILGEVLKAIYSPSGLYSANDAMLEDILRRLDLWKQNLPVELTFTGPESKPAAGLLHVYYTCVCMIFWRVFMRISFICPPHLQFSLNVTEWNKVIENARSAILWFDRNDIYWDSWFATSYSLVSCGLSQYHTWARRKDEEAVTTLLVLRDAVKRWESKASISEHPTRAKVGEILCLLYEVTKTPQSGPANILAPTIGMRERSDAVFENLTFRKDTKGGAYVTSDPKIAAQLKELPQGTIITEPNTPATSSIDDPGSRDGTMFSNGPVSLMDTRDRAPSRDSIGRPPQPPTVYSHPNAPDQLGIDGVPGNMFDWGGWDTWLQSLGTEPLSSLALNGTTYPPPSS